jgi:hypothetical protein
MAADEAAELSFALGSRFRRNNDLACSDKAKALQHVTERVSIVELD